MNITRINEFQALDGQAEALTKLIKSFLPTIRASEGCRSCELLHSDGEPERIVVIEEWDSRETHQASTKNIPTETLQAAMKLLAGPPKGRYYVVQD